MTIAAVLLAAGRSTRFGSDKIAAPLDGLPLGLHAARTMRALPLDAWFVVTNAVTLDWQGWEIVRNGHPEAGISHSIALGVGAARSDSISAVLIALADMPFVPAEHFIRLLEAYQGSSTLAASSDGTRPMPPALFGSNWFDALQVLTGDQGAQALLKEAKIVETRPAHLIDVDRPEDFIAVRDRISR